MTNDGQSHITEELLYDYAAGCADADSSKLAEAHLSECEACRCRLEWIRSVSQALQKAVPVPSDAIRKELYTGIHKDEKRKSRQQFLRLGGIAASLMIVCGALMFGGTKLMYQSEKETNSKYNLSGMPSDEYQENVTAPRHDSAAIDKLPPRYPGEMIIGSGLTEIMQSLGITGTQYGELSYYVLNEEEKALFDSRIVDSGKQLILYDMGPEANITANNNLTDADEKDIRQALMTGKTVILDVGNE